MKCDGDGVNSSSGGGRGTAEQRRRQAQQTCLSLAESWLVMAFVSYGLLGRF